MAAARVDLKILNDMMRVLPAEKIAVSSDRCESKQHQYQYANLPSGTIEAYP